MKECLFEEKGIYYRRNEFSPGRPTLFLVHGVSGSSSAWFAYESAFEGKYNVLSLDLRGHGKSIRFKKYEDYEIGKFSEDLYDLLKHCGVEKCILASNSFGTLVALDFIGKHQNMVSAAIFISPHFAVGRMASARLVKPFIRLAVKMRPEHSPKKIVGQVDYSKYVDTKDWSVRRNIADITNTGLWVYLYVTAQTYNFNGEDILKKIKVPTLVVHGAKDTIFPLRYGVMVAEKIENAKLAVIDDIDHIVVLNRSKRLIEIMSDFIDGLSGL
jgi:pimeloyl-ACP methyl ester carboxylesterase